MIEMDFCEQARGYRELAQTYNGGITAACQQAYDHYSRARSERCCIRCKASASSHVK